MGKGAVCVETFPAPQPEVPRLTLMTGPGRVVTASWGILPALSLLGLAMSTAGQGVPVAVWTPPTTAVMSLEEQGPQIPGTCHPASGEAVTSGNNCLALYSLCLFMCSRLTNAPPLCLLHK